MRLLVLLAFLAIVLTPTEGANAQSSECVTKGPDEGPVCEIERLERENSLLRAQLAADWKSSLPKMAHDKYLENFYRQESELRAHTVSAFQWQASASNWILFLVVAIATSGILFAGYQLYMTLRIIEARGVGPLTGSGGETGPVPNLATALNVTATSLQLTSSVVGIVVLIISLAFLLLFLRLLLRLLFSA